MKNKRLLVIGALACTSLSIASCGQRPDTTHLQKRIHTLDQSEAEKIALTRFTGRIVKSELTTDDGRQVWQVEISQEQKGMKEVHVDALSGEVLKEELEEVTKTKIDQQQAEQAALKTVPGNLLHTELEHENGAATWCVEIASKTGTKEVYVNAENGAIHHVEDKREHD